MPPKLVRRDFWQSVRSLLSISGFLAAGEVLYAHGYGFQIEFSWGTAALSLLASMLIFDTWFYWLQRVEGSRNRGPFGVKAKF